MTPIDYAAGALGLVLVLFVPGFFALRAIAPERRDLAETVALSVIGSVAVTILVGAALGFTGRFRRDDLLLALALAAGALGALAHARGGFRRARPVEHPRPEEDEMRRAAELRAQEAARRATGDAEGAARADREAREVEARLDARRSGP